MSQYSAHVCTATGSMHMSDMYTCIFGFQEEVSLRILQVFTWLDLQNAAATPLQRGLPKGETNAGQRFNVSSNAKPVRHGCNTQRHRARER